VRVQPATHPVFHRLGNDRDLSRRAHEDWGLTDVRHTTRAGGCINYVRDGRVDQLLQSTGVCVLMIRIPIYRPSLSGNELRYVTECIESTWISSKGTYIADFERRFAEYTQARHATAVCNGTVALHLALVALGIGPGDEVLVPTLTYVAAVNAITYTGAVPVFVDSLASTWQMDPDDVVRKVTPKTRAIMAVHVYGHPCDMASLLRIARERSLFLIEDCAEAIGSRYHGRHVGTFGDIAAFSFYGNKTITTGEGGMVITNDETLHARCVHFKGQGLAAHRQYWHDVVGYNYRMTNICAALGVAQLEQIDTFIQRKRELADLYRSELQAADVTVHAEANGVLHSYWMNSVLVRDSALRDPLREHLESLGIETRPVFYPVHTMPMYATKFQRHPVAEDIGWRGINLPSWPGLRTDEVRFICDTIRAYLETRRSTPGIAT
jgi:perosamine synthetase